IPRPPNCYILFRSNYCVENKKLGSKAELDHRVVSKMASIAWNALSRADKKPWEDRAREKKIEHAQNYPGYSYSP
ncbi:high mobility group box domain-containing protein, partial [Mycena galopus ATCC 62051]